MASDFTFSISYAGNDFSIKKEICSVDMDVFRYSTDGTVDSSSEPGSARLNYTSRQNEVHLSHGDEPFEVTSTGSGNLFLSMSSLQQGGVAGFFLCQTISNFETYAIFPNTLRHPQKQSSETILSEHGDNLASVLKRLRGEKKAALSDVIEAMMSEYIDRATRARPLATAQKQAVKEHLFSLGQLMTIEGLHG